MEGQKNRAIGLWESWHRKQDMLESVFGSGISAELDKEKFEFLSAGIARISPGANADEKLVLAMLKKTNARLEKQLYPNPVLCMLRRIKALVYDRPVQAARLRQMKSDNISSLSSELGRIGVNPEKLDLEKRLDYESPRLNIAISSPYGTDHNLQMTLHMERQDSGAYELKDYTAVLKDPVNPEKSRSYTFDAASGVNAREAVNLLQGRAVMKYFQVGENRMGSKWLQLDFNSSGPSGQPVLKEIPADHEYNIHQQVTRIAEVLNKPELAGTRAIKGLEGGNQLVLKELSGEKTFLEVDMLKNQVVIKGIDQLPVSLEKLTTERQKKQDLEKSERLDLSKTKTKNKQQDQSLHIS